jgi:RNA 2',3'-cyclic 3'-phosphodiesterase
MRLFIAVNLSPEARNAIQSSIDEFPVKNPPWRWVSPDNWHLTLKFLGETETARLNTLFAGLDEVRRQHTVFTMTLGAFGGFPNLRNPRVLFYDVERGAPELRQLANDVDGAVEQALGLARETRAYQAHATIARVKDPLSPEIAARFGRVSPLTEAVTRVDSFELMESRLARTGATYSVVKEFALS